MWLRAWRRLWLLTVWKIKVAADNARDARNWRRAAELYETVLRRAPYMDAMRIQLGHMYKEAGEFDLAAGQYYDVLERRPQDDDLRLQIGHLEKLRRNWGAAVHQYGEAARINLGNGDALWEYQALGGALSVDPASTDRRPARARWETPGAMADHEGATAWPSPDDQALPPMPPEVREIYAMITRPRSGY